MAARQSTQGRCDLALTEIEALAVNQIHDVRSLEARLERGGLGLVVLAYPELRIIETGAECIRHELAEARAASAPVVQSPAERAADMATAHLRPLSGLRTSSRPAA